MDAPSKKPRNRGESEAYLSVRFARTQEFVCDGTESMDESGPNSIRGQAVRQRKTPLEQLLVAAFGGLQRIAGD